jgi:glucosylceramidase
VIGARRGRLALAIVIAVAIGGGAAVAQSAAAVPAPPRRVAIKPPQLSLAERRAITIKSVSAAGDGASGLIVSVTFDGDIERRLGQGHLAQGLLSLVLVPSFTSATATGLVDEGGGFTPMSVPIVARRGRHLTAKAGSVNVFSPEHTFREDVAGGAWVLRHDTQVVFYLSRAAVADAARIEVRLYARSPTSLGPLTSAGWRRVVAQRPTDRASLRADPAGRSYRELTAAGGELSHLVSSGLAPELRHLQHAAATLKAAIGAYSNLRRAIEQVPSLRSVRKHELVDALNRTKLRTGHLKTQITRVERLIVGIDGRAKACARPSPSTATPVPSPSKPVVVVQTDAALCEAMTPGPSVALSTVRPSRVPVIDIDDRVRYQRFSGLGAAMTDSSAWLIYDQLPAAGRASLMQDLFGLAGIHLDFLRVPMAASDFTVSGQPYTYDDVRPTATDPTLSQFSIAHDSQYIIPTVRAALAVNAELEIIASPWSPPAWMKANDSLDNIDGRGTLLRGAFHPLASYFVRFIQAYASEGVGIDAITPQNEPAAFTAYPGLTLSEIDEEQFISQDLQPALAAAGLHPKIYGADASWDQIGYVEPLASGSATGDLSGIAWHCYFGSPTSMSQLHDAVPSLDQIVDECSPEIRTFGTPEFLISSLRNWASVVAVWNVALDPQGNPRQPANGCPGCRGLVTIDEQAHTVGVGREYFQLGQVSAFVQPGAARIGSPTFVRYGSTASDIETVSAGLDDVAFLNPDGSKVLVVYDNSSVPIPFGAGSDGSYFTYTIPAHAMTTFTWR